MSQEWKRGQTLKLFFFLIERDGHYLKGFSINIIRFSYLSVCIHIFVIFFYHYSRTLTAIFNETEKIDNSPKKKNPSIHGNITRSLHQSMYQPILINFIKIAFVHRHVLVIKNWIRN
jgi:hypothetical protein